jgi:hypothetical protein
LKNIALVLTSTTVFWTIVTLLFLTAYIKKRRRQKQLIKSWEGEEQILSSLPHEEYESEENDDWL